VIYYAIVDANGNQPGWGTTQYGDHGARTYANLARLEHGGSIWERPGAGDFHIARLIVRCEYIDGRSNFVEG